MARYVHARGYKHRIINKELRVNWDIEYPQHLGNKYGIKVTGQIRTNQEFPPYITNMNALRLWGLISCILCNTTNPLDKELCSGCGKILKFKLKG